MGSSAVKVVKRERALQTGQFNKNTEKDNYSSWNAFLISYWHLESTAKFKRKALKNIWGHPVQWKERNFFFTGKGNKIHYDLLALRIRHYTAHGWNHSLSLSYQPSYLSLFPSNFPPFCFPPSRLLFLYNWLSFISRLCLFSLYLSHIFPIVFSSLSQFLPVSFSLE